MSVDDSQKILGKLIEAIRLRRKYMPCGDHNQSYYDSVELARASSSEGVFGGKSEKAKSSNVLQTPERKKRKNRKADKAAPTTHARIVEEDEGEDAEQSAGDDTDSLYRGDDEGTDWLDPFWEEDPPEVRRRSMSQFAPHRRNFMP